MEMGQQSRRAVVAAARLALEQWSQRLGVGGREAMRATPGLTAVVDQHVAQIRAAITAGAGLMRPDTLAAYADGVADAAAAKGWTAREVESGWHQPSWPSVHLLAVCVLADAVM
jgi:hypothetical protein